MYVKVFSINFSFFFIIGQGQNSDKNFVSKKTIKLRKEIFNAIKKHSLYKDSLNWKEISRESDQLELGKNDSINQSILFKFYTSKLRKAGDKHSFFLSREKMKAKSEKTIAAEPKGAYLGESIGMIKVPRCLNFDPSKDIAFANKIRSEIKEVDTQNEIKGWIVDLRHNTGGNMWPMLAGLNALIEDGTVGYFILPESNKKLPWNIVKGQLVLPKGNVDDYKIKNNKIKIAVLIDSMTGSSGETTAISFLGLPNVKTFGEPSAGYTSSNYTFPLSDGSKLFLAKGYAVDRDGKVYKDKILPDIAVKDEESTSDDEVINKAKLWLLE